MTTAPQQSWLSRNFRIAVFGCLGVLIAMFCFAGALVYGVFYMIKSSDAFQISLKQVQADVKVQNVLGNPIRDGWYVTGQVNVNGSSGTADIGYPISGPKGSGMVYVTATKAMGTWTIHKLEIAVDGQKQRLTLIPPPKTGIQPVEAPAAPAQHENNSNN